MLKGNHEKDFSPEKNMIGSNDTFIVVFMVGNERYKNFMFSKDSNSNVKEHMIKCKTYIQSKFFSINFSNPSNDFPPQL